MKANKLYLSEKDRKIAGVCGGIGETYGIDITLCRLLWAFLTLVSGILPGIILYLIAIIVIPENPNSTLPKTPPKPVDHDEQRTPEGGNAPRGFARIKEDR
jgi:phage shock protein PspC (stress-responsive transcriptional regulator)